MNGLAFYKQIILLVMTKTTVSISLTKELIERIDSERKLVSRSAYIEFLLKKLLEDGNNEL